MKPWIGPANNIANTVGQNKGYDVHLENMTTSDFFNHIIEEKWCNEVRFFMKTMIISLIYDKNTICKLVQLICYYRYKICLLWLSEAGQR